MIIAIDFDGTCVTHEFPNIGDSIGAERVLRELVSNGHQLILFTMRSHRKNCRSATNSEGYDPMELETDVLEDAVEWFNKNKIPLFGINENPDQKSWSDSPKPYAHLYIDDSALGVPLVYGLHDRPYVDWDLVRYKLDLKGFFDKNEDEND